MCGRRQRRKARRRGVDGYVSALLLPLSSGRSASKRYFADVLSSVVSSFLAPRWNGTILRQPRENGVTAIGSRYAISISGHQRDFKQPCRYISYAPPFPPSPGRGLTERESGKGTHRGPLNPFVPKANSVWRAAVLRRGPLVRKQDRGNRGSGGGDRPMHRRP